MKMGRRLWQLLCNDSSASLHPASPCHIELAKSEVKPLCMLLILGDTAGQWDTFLCHVCVCMHVCAGGWKRSRKLSALVEGSASVICKSRVQRHSLFYAGRSKVSECMETCNGSWNADCCSFFSPFLSLKGEMAFV